MESQGSLPAKESQVSVPEGYEVVCAPGGLKYLVPSHFVPDVKLKLAVEETRDKMQVDADQSEVRIYRLPHTNFVADRSSYQCFHFGSRAFVWIQDQKSWPAV